MLKSIKSLDRWLDSHVILWVLLGVMAFLRLPNFFEPYWYGDEGIYLTIGTALRHGGILYQSIVDHKTPLIYYLAMVPTLVSFRVLLFIWSTLSIFGFYVLSLKVLKSLSSRLIAGLAFMLLTTLPWFEGHVANGELFVLGFVMLGWAVISSTSLFNHFLKGQEIPLTVSTFKLKTLSEWQSLTFFVAGIFFGLGILTKVPALFDAAAVAVFFWWVWLKQLDLKQLKNRNYWLKQLTGLVITAGIFGVGLLLPLILSMIYFVFRGAGADYLQFGLLYNFHYASNWTLPFTQPWLLWLFTLPGKFLVVLLTLAILSLGHRRFSPSVLFASGWFILALFASLLSNRPYPHYYIQVLPPVALLIGLSIDSLRHLLQRHHPQRALLQLLPAVALLGLFLSVLLLLNVGVYSVQTYYTQFFRLVTGRITAAEYRNSFNHLMADNYAAAPLLSTSEDNQLFIWGTNPSLYALTQTVPVGKFTVAFHIKDLGAYEETYQAVVSARPEYIVIMNEDKDTFPELTTWMKNYYIPNHTYDHFVVWKLQTAQL